MGRAGLPVSKASTSSVFQPYKRSAAVRPGSPQPASSAGSPGMPPTSISLRMARTAALSESGFSASTCSTPRALTSEAMAFASWMPGLLSSPPQLPE